MLAALAGGGAEVRSGLGAAAHRGAAPVAEVLVAAPAQHVVVVANLVVRHRLRPPQNVMEILEAGGLGFRV